MKRNKYIVYVIVMIMIVSIGVSYSYFVSSNSMNQKEIKITSKDISIVLTDNMVITDTTITPGWNTSKTFTVKNNSDEVFNYNIIIKDLINTFVTEGYLQYKITSTNGYNMTEYVDVPKSSSPTDTILAYDIDINPGVLQEYTIEFIYHDSEENQSEDMGKVFSGTLAIVEGTIDPNKFYAVTLEIENGRVIDTNPKTSLKNGSVTFEVEPDTGYEISGSIECDGSATASLSGSTITISGIKEDQICTVNTSKKTYTLSIGTNNANMGTVSPASPVIEHGSDATITLSPKTGYKYSSNDCGGSVSGNTMTISNVTAAKTCTVTFAAITYAVSVSSNNTNMGTVSPTSTTITHGSNATITLSPKTGYKYSSNDCGGSVSGNTMTISNITEAKTCTVAFTPITYAVNVSSNDTNMGTVSPTSLTVNYGSNATITLSPKTGYVYSSNNCGGTVSGNTMTISNVTEAKTCAVTFTPITYTVSTSITGGTASPTSRIVNHGSNATFTINPNSGYALTGATVSGPGCSLSGSTLTASNVTSARTCSVTLVKTSCIVYFYAANQLGASTVYSLGTQAMTNGRTAQINTWSCGGGTQSNSGSSTPNIRVTVIETGEELARGKMKDVSFTCQLKDLRVDIVSSACRADGSVTLK